ncbi:MAG: 6-bladed beta-propeller [Prevotellaceae bacterium]|nr:6-bladed beta-propeller [Prevotellaceae bacterium]
MNNRFNLIFTVFFCAYAASCTENIETHVNVQTITLSDEELNTKYKASDIFEDITLIPLETADEILIGEVSKIEIIDSMIYILDRQSKTFMSFDMNGQVVTKIHNVGQGPSDYIYPRDFTLLKNKDILILDEIEKLIHFKSDGSHYRTYQLPFYADDFESVNDTLFIFSGATSDKAIYVWNITTNRIINTFFEYDKKHMGKIFKPLIRYADNIYFERQYSSVIYSVTPEQVTKYWFIDFGKRNVNGNILEGIYGLSFILPSAAEYGEFTETDKIVTFYFQVEDIKEGMPHYVYYSKSSKKKIITVYDNYDNDISFDCNPQNIFGATESGQVFETIYPAYYLKNVLKQDTASMDMEKKQRWINIQKQIKGVNEYDNPIVAIYSLKDF